MASCGREVLVFRTIRKSGHPKRRILEARQPEED